MLALAGIGLAISKGARLLRRACRRGISLVARRPAASVVGVAFVISLAVLVWRLVLVREAYDEGRWVTLQGIKLEYVVSRSTINDICASLGSQAKACAVWDFEVAPWGSVVVMLSRRDSPFYPKTENLIELSAEEDGGISYSKLLMEDDDILAFTFDPAGTLLASVWDRQHKANYLAQFTNGALQQAVVLPGEAHRLRSSAPGMVNAVVWIEEGGERHLGHTDLYRFNVNGTAEKILEMPLPKGQDYGDLIYDVIDASETSGRNNWILATGNRIVSVHGNAVRVLYKHPKWHGSKIIASIAMPSSGQALFFSTVDHRVYALRGLTAIQLARRVGTSGPYYPTPGKYSLSQGWSRLKIRYHRGSLYVFDLSAQCIVVLTGMERILGD